MTYNSEASKEAKLITTQTLGKVSFNVPEFKAKEVLKLLQQKELESNNNVPVDIVIENIVTLHNVGRITLVHCTPRESGHSVDRMWDNEMRSWRPILFSIEFSQHLNL